MTSSIADPPQVQASTNGHVWSVVGFDTRAEARKLIRRMISAAPVTYLDVPTFQELLRFCSHTQPDLVILGSQRAFPIGESVHMLLRNHKDLRVIVIGSRDDTAGATEAMRFGALGFVQWSADPLSMLAAMSMTPQIRVAEAPPPSFDRLSS